MATSSGLGLGPSEPVLHGDGVDLSGAGPLETRDTAFTTEQKVELERMFQKQLEQTEVMLQRLMTTASKEKEGAGRTARDEKDP